MSEMSPAEQAKEYAAANNWELAAYREPGNRTYAATKAFGTNVEQVKRSGYPALLTAMLATDSAHQLEDTTEATSSPSIVESFEYTATIGDMELMMWKETMPKDIIPIAVRVAKVAVDLLATLVVPGMRCKRRVTRKMRQVCSFTTPLAVMNNHHRGPRKGRHGRIRGAHLAEVQQRRIAALARSAKMLNTTPEILAYQRAGAALVIPFAKRKPWGFHILESGLSWWTGNYAGAVRMSRRVPNVGLTVSPITYRGGV